MNCLKYYLESERIVNIIKSNSGLSLAAIKLLIVCGLNLSKQNDLISKSALLKLNTLPTGLNIPRTLKQLTDAGFLVAYPMTRKIIYKISTKGRLLLQNIEFSLIEIDT